MKKTIKMYGGKPHLASWVIENFPENYQKYNYIEPYCGAGSVLLNKDKPEDGKIEVINDINLGVAQIFFALRDEPKHFINSLNRKKCTERVFERELKSSKETEVYEDYIDHAFNEYIIRRMSKGGLKKTFAWTEESDATAWDAMLEDLPTISERIKDVKILNHKATKVISAFDSESALCFCDPPRLHDTRAPKDNKEEMTDDEHIELSDTLHKFRGKVIIAGCQSILYKRLYKEWRCVKKAAPNTTQKVKIECIWMNY